MRVEGYVSTCTWGCSPRCTELQPLLHAGEARVQPVSPRDVSRPAQLPHSRRALYLLLTTYLAVGERASDTLPPAVGSAVALSVTVRPIPGEQQESASEWHVASSEQDAVSAHATRIPTTKLRFSN